MQCSQRKERQPLISHSLKINKILDDALDFGVVKPGHFCHFSKQNYDHLCNLLVQTKFFLNEEVYEKVFNSEPLIDRNL